MVSLSRITPPTLPRILQRPRLENQLKQYEDRRVVVILGQAAQGKSTLAASFAQSSYLPFTWINIASEDKAPINLYYVTAEALRPFLDKKATEAVLNYPAFQLGPRNPEALYRDWIHTLFSNIKEPIRVVFDGLDRLPDGSASFVLLRLMMEAAPEIVKFVLLSRKDPPLPVHDWKIKQHAFLLFNRDLAFTYHETQSFLRGHCGLKCSTGEVKKVWKATEGWTGGLVILSQVLQSSGDPSARLNFIGDLPDRFKVQVFLYFANEIFSCLSEQDAWFLMHSAIFEDVDPDFLDQLLDMRGSETVLLKLIRQNLFVHSVHESDAKRIYRYHLLFRDFLQRMWKRQTDLEQRQHFLHRTAKAYARKNDLEKAASFFLDTEDYDRAASVLRIHGRSMIQAQRHTDLADMLLRFSERVIKRKPWLLLYRAVCRRYTHAAENVKDLQRAEAKFREIQDIRGRLLTLGYLLEAFMLLGRDPVPIHTLLAEGKTLLSALDSSTFPREQALLWLQMGFCYALRGEDSREGYRASQNAYFLARKLKDRPLEIHALINAMIPLILSGEYMEADEIRIRVERMLQKGRYLELEAAFWKFWSELVLMGGRLDLETGAHLVGRLNKRIERLGLLYIQAPAMYSELALHIYAGHTDKAEEIGQRLQHFADGTDNLYAKGMCYLLRGLHAYWLGQWDKAGERMETGLEIFRRPDMKSPFHDHVFSTGAALIHFHLGNGQKAERLLLRSLQYFTRTSNQLDRTEALLSLALLNDKQGRRVEALEYLETGLHIAAARQFISFVVMSPQDQIRVCVLAMEAGTKPSADYAAHLLKTSLAEAAAAEGPWLQNHPHPGVRKTTEQVMLSRHRRQRPRLYIQSLGGFRVWVGGEVLPDSRWDGSQAQILLKSIVALASEKKVRKEMLTEALWPEGPPGTGEKRFKVTLHRLRRSLEPDMNSRFGSSYIHLQNKQVYLDPELCANDVALFLQSCRETERLLKSDQDKKAVKRFEEAATLYQGDFLPEDLHAEWARDIRQWLRQKYTTVLMELARAYERFGSWTKAVRHYESALGCDPLLEEAYRRIMVLCADHGRRTKALHAYEKCRKVLRDTLDVEPEDLTTSLYLKIRE